MGSTPQPLVRYSPPLLVLRAAEADALTRDRSPRFQFTVPNRWRSAVLINPCAIDAERQVIDWFASLGCPLAELQRARKFDVAGYVGIPFPNLTLEKTVLTAKYLSLWLLWDDMQVERVESESRWRIDEVEAITGRTPEGMTRFDLGWWQVFQELAAKRTRRWLGDVCQAMKTWNEAAAREAVMMRDQRERGLLPDFEEQLETRIATIGMYATLYLFEDAYDFELPAEFHADATVLRMKKLAGKIVGLGNDVFSFGKDFAADQINLITTLMYETGMPCEDAIADVIRMHDQAIEEYDRLSCSLRSFGAEADPFVARWVKDVRYASLGFSLWESQAPRYTAYKIVANGLVIEPGFLFTEAPASSTDAPLE